MKTMWLCCLLAFATVVTSVKTADAAFVGLARGSCTSCDTSCEPSCAAPCGPRLVKDVIYEKKEFTCYKTVCEKVVEQKEVAALASD